MTRQFKKKFIFITLILCLLLICGLSAGENEEPEKTLAGLPDEENIVILINKSAPQSYFNKKEIQRIFTARLLLWKTGEPFTIVMLKDKKSLELFLDKYIDMTSKHFIQTWKRHVVTGKGRSPIRLDTNEQIIDYISKNRFAIGYIKGTTENASIICVD